MKKIETLFALILTLLLTSCKQDATGPPATPASVAPSITQHPTNVTLMVGQTATFRVNATGTAPLSYQWQKNGTTVAGAVNASYTLVVTSADSGNSFRCIVSNTAGSATSNAATLNAVAPVVPTITAQPVSQTVLSPAPATFQFLATGATAYQWQTLSGGSWTNVSGATIYILRFDSTDYGQSGMQIRCVASNSAGSVTSETVTLTVQLGFGSLHMNGIVIKMPNNGAGSGLIAAKYDQSRGVLTTPAQRDSLCAIYGANYRLPADTTELRLLKAAKDARVLVNFINPSNSETGPYVSSMSNTYQGQQIVLVMLLNVGYEHFGWVPENNSVCIRAVRSF